MVHIIDSFTDRVVVCRKLNEQFAVSKHSSSISDWSSDCIDCNKFFKRCSNVHKRAGVKAVTIVMVRKEKRIQMRKRQKELVLFLGVIFLNNQ